LYLLIAVIEARRVSGVMIGLITAMDGIATLLISLFAAPPLERIGVPATLMASIILFVLSFLAFTGRSLWLWSVRT
jgi:hypothetical protein